MLESRTRDMVCLSRAYHFKFLKGCLPQISVGPYLNTLSHIQVTSDCSNVNVAFLDINDESKNDSEYNKLLDLGTFILHTLTNALKQVENLISWDI